MSTRDIRLVDARRGHARRGWPLMVPFLVGAALLFAGAGYASVSVMSAFGILLLAVPRVFEWAHRGRTRIHIEPGRVRIGAMTILARKVLGASTARVSDGILVTIKSKQREPLSFVVKDDRAADEILAALGIGHTGAGRLEWIVLKRSFTMFLGVFEWLLGILMALAFAYALQQSENAIVYAMFSFMIMGVAAILRTQWTANAQSVAFDPWGVWVSGHQIPWSSLERADEHPEGIALTYDGGYVIAKIPTDGLRQAEKDAVLEQIRAGIGRAHGLGIPKPEPHTRIDVLARSGHAVRHWLARIDTLASGIGKPGYRETSLEIEDLWLTLDDPEAPADLRAAASRLLYRLEPRARVRIDAAIAAVREPADGERMRIAMEADVDEAAMELERLEKKAS